ncbi:MAG: DUF502 domain-containing protein [Chloroflexi bacterium]|nr:DUF502 domain-containing protein [Chloroflexota bacterium]
MKEEQTETFRHRLIRTTRRHFLAGILVAVPLGAAIAILVWLFTTIDNLLQPAIQAVLGRKIIGLGFVVTAALVYLIGVIADNYFGRRILRFLESLAGSIPVFRQLYFSFKQVMEKLSGGGLGKAAFREVVLVEFPRQGMRALAFVTNELIDESGKKVFAIYVPTAPLPTSGFFGMVSEDMITRTSLSVDEAMRMVISSGMVSPAKIEAREKPESQPPAAPG